MTDRQRMMGQYIGLVLQDPRIAKIKTARERTTRMFELIREDFFYVWDSVAREACGRLMSSVVDNALRGLFR